MNLSSIDILFTNYRDARALSRVLVNEKSRRGGHCLGGCNNEAWAIFIEIEVAHARLIYEFKLSKIVEHERNVIPIFIN